MYSQQDQQVKTVINTEDIKEIVSLLNQKFNESYNLYSFDEQNQFEFLELLNKIFQHLDPKWSIDAKVDNAETIIYKITNYLRILFYPSSYDEKWAQGLLSTDKKVIYPIFYYLLTRLGEWEKRAYLARFLVPVYVPDEFQMDNDIKVCLDQIKDLSAQFSVHHQQMEAVQQQSMNPQDLKREISQLEQEREQLMTKISQFKNKVANKPNFSELLDVTNMLRREQEEEARLADKLRQQRQQLEWTDQQLMSAQQRLIDTQKSLAPENSPEQMLLALKNEVKKNRELSRDRLGFDLKERRKKLDQVEKLLGEPPITTNELNSLENNLMNLRRAVNQMEDKLRREAKPEDDKLAIYKQQVQLVAKKKERAVEDVKKAEEDLQFIQKEVFKKEEQIRVERGPNYITKDQFQQYAQVLKDKKQQHTKLKHELKGLQVERAILERTEQILRRQKVDLTNEVKELEKRHGVVGYTGLKEGLEKLSDQKSELDQKKGATLEEISKLVTEIQSQINQKRPLIQDQLSEIKELRQQVGTLEKEHKSKKQEYDRAMLGIESDQNYLQNEVKKLREEVYGYDRKIRLYKYNSEILEIKFQRMNDEVDYLKGGNKKLNNNFQSNAEMLQNRILELEKNIKSLKQQREQVKENYEPSLRQMNYFTDFKKIMATKLALLKHEHSQKPAAKYGQDRMVIN